MWDNRRGLGRAGCYHTTMNEQPRPAASTDEHTFLLSVEEATDRYAAVSHAWKALEKTDLIEEPDPDNGKKRIPGRH
jgi:hypothetical protein